MVQKWRPIEEAPLSDGVRISAAWFDCDEPVPPDARPEHIEELIWRDGAWRTGRRMCSDSECYTPTHFRLGWGRWT